MHLYFTDIIFVSAQDRSYFCEEDGMKRLLLPILLILVLAISASASAAPEDETLSHARRGVVTLRAGDVTSAVDVEAAMAAATRDGTRPGVVVLDGRDGPFVYASEDRSINVFHPNVTFRGINGAMFTNCGDGFFFDDLPTDNVRIEGLIMRCENSFVYGGVNKRNIVIKNNTALTPNASIDAMPGKGWVITGNTFDSAATSVVLTQGANSVVSNNRIRAQIGVALHGCSNTHVYANTIWALEQGILLQNETVKSQVKNNTILGVMQAGITLDTSAQGNTITRNSVLFAWGVECPTVFAEGDAAAANFISRNQP